MSGSATLIPPPDGDWIDAWLSPDRLARYVGAASGDRARALALYEWNAQVSAALQRDLSHLEIALRNAYDAAANAGWSGPGHWLRDDAPTVFAPVWRTKRRGGHRQRVDINRKPRELVEVAIRAAGPGASAGKVVAELNFGFWRYLSSSAHEKSLWVPMLYRAFPPGTSRARIDARIGRLHDLRNRVAHHEPILAVDLPARLDDLLVVARALHPPLADHIDVSTRLRRLIAVRP